MFRRIVKNKNRFNVFNASDDYAHRIRKCQFGGVRNPPVFCLLPEDSAKQSRKGGNPKDIARAHFAHRVEVQLAYAIGVAEPVSISVDCFGTNIVPKRFITNWICKHYDLTPAGIISFLGLRDVDYNMVSCGGHFRCGWMPWEK